MKYRTENLLISGIFWGIFLLLVTALCTLGGWPGIVRIFGGGQ